MKGLMLVPIEPLVKEAIQDTGCIQWLASNSQDLTPITSFLTNSPVQESIRTMGSECFLVKSENWKEELANVLKQIYKELPDFSFAAIVADDSDDFMTVSRLGETDKTCFRHAKVKYIKSFQNPDVFLTEVL